jgi:hypothetical protein
VVETTRQGLLACCFLNLILNMKSYDTLIEALKGLKAEGYTEDFNLQSHCLKCSSSDRQLQPEEFTIDKFYRFEGASNPDDNSIVYAISSIDGLKGVLVDAYGIYADNLNEEMVQKLKIERS